MTKFNEVKMKISDSFLESLESLTSYVLPQLSIDCTNPHGDRGFEKIVVYFDSQEVLQEVCQGLKHWFARPGFTFSTKPEAFTREELEEIVKENLMYTRENIPCVLNKLRTWIATR